MLFVPPPISTILPWFPKHQQTTLRLLGEGRHHIDVVVEVRDARIPLSGANRQFDHVLGQRDRIVLFNKMDLANPNMSQLITQSFPKYAPQHQFLFTSAKPRSGLNGKPWIKKIMKLLVEKAQSDPSRWGNNMSVIVVGLPNVGKSSIINALRHYGTNKGKVSAVASHAGVTRAIQTKVKIHSDPTIYLVDTPGVLNPEFKSPIQGLRVALTGSTKDSLSNELAIVEYLLFRLNQNKNSLQIYTMGLGIPQTNNIQELLDAIIAKSQLKDALAHERRARDKGNWENYDPNSVVRTVPGDEILSVPRGVFNRVSASRAFVHMFRDGSFGPITLDDCSPEGIKSWFEYQDAIAMGTRDVSLEREAQMGRIVYAESPNTDGNRQKAL
ncbi:P-loop containing nucleoside triphosphate hydrolase protein [Obelidium mucronatum]|nr:P-loop containing nucleoside triphosphate hydrolase protein [Obelidium mucronatum]